MKSVNIDVLRLVTLVVSNGIYSAREIADACRKSLKTSDHVGHAADGHSHLYSLFVANKYDDQGNRLDGVYQWSEDGERLKFNLRSSAAKAQNAQRAERTSRTPGQVLRGGRQQAQAGTPPMTPDVIRYLQAVAAQVAGQAPAPQPQPQPEADSGPLFNEADFDGLF